MKNSEEQKIEDAAHDVAHAERVTETFCDECECVVTDPAHVEVAIFRRENKIKKENLCESCGKEAPPLEDFCVDCLVAIKVSKD